MSAFDSFGVHIDIARDSLRRSLDLAPTGLDQFSVIRRLPPAIGRGTVELVSLGRGLGYLQGQCRDTTAEARARIELPACHFQFAFHLASSPIQAQIDGVSRPLYLMRSDTLLLGTATCGTLVLRPGAAAHEIGIFADAELIDSCFADNHRPLPPRLRQTISKPEREPLALVGDATAAMGLALRQMLTCGLNGSFARVYLEAKVLEIISLRLAQLDGDGNRPRRLQLSRRDLELFDEARHVLMTEFRKPPTISELAQILGVNRTKLKAGFKRQFGTTVFGFIRSQRMQHALELLRDGNCNVTEAANMVGYSSLSAFAAAFRLEFGFCPSSVCRDAAQRNGVAAAGCADQ
ncbi:MAG: AraC family transcriptional regulator [Spirochaetaceae bacterium]|nr:MAG: AraC family transcriptional regulator [Spirochaetaceae bacterium]